MGTRTREVLPPEMLEEIRAEEATANAGIGPPPKQPIFCTACGGKVRWRRVRDDRYSPPEQWELPERCSRCGAKPAPGDRSIATRFGS